jgi:PBP1b-binding outer membrane lipoprotein LpoB
MLDLKKIKIFVVLNILLLVLSACSNSTQNENQISTAVAQTVQAQNSLTKVATMATIPATPTPADSLETSTTPLAPAVTDITNSR